MAYTTEHCNLFKKRLDGVKKRKKTGEKSALEFEPRKMYRLGIEKQTKVGESHAAMF